MIKLAPLVLLLNITHAQESHNRQSRTGKSHSTKIIVPIYFQENIVKEYENSSSRKKSRYCLLLQNLEQQTGRKLSDNCVRQALVHRRPGLMNRNRADDLDEKYAKEEQDKKTQAQREVILTKIKQSVGNNLKNLEKMCKLFFLLEKIQDGFIRMT